MKNINSKGVTLISVILVFLIILGVILGIKPIRERIFGLINKPTTKVTPYQTPVDSKSIPTSVSTKSDKYGINTGILVPEEPYFNSAMDWAAKLGVGWIRIGSDWSGLEPKDNQWNFSESDKEVNAAYSRGFKILYEFDPDLNGAFCTMAPGTGLKSLLRPKLPRCTDEQFKDYITQIVTRYKGKVTHYELGNEPDLRPTWRDYPGEYAEALALAYPTLKAADPNAKLLLGGLALGGGQNSSMQWVKLFLNDRTNPPLNNFDIMNYHTYDKKDGITRQFNDVKSRVGGKPIWITEVGYPSEGGRVGFPYPAGEDGQAEYMKDILPHFLSLGAEKVFWYTLVDVPRENSEFCTYGLVYIPGKQCMGAGEQRNIGGELKTKKAYNVYKELIK